MTNISKSKLDNMVAQAVAKIMQQQNNQPPSPKQKAVSDIGDHKSHAHRKGQGKATSAKPAPSDVDHSLNLRCPKEGCEYLAKTTTSMMKLGRLKCPVHHISLQTKEERGETRGRKVA